MQQLRHGEAYGKMTFFFTTCDEKYSRSLEFPQRLFFFFWFRCLAKFNLHGNWLKVEINFISNKATSEIQYTSS